ncbi:MAG: hypothetical protein WDA07_14910 [Leucobacter sp.]
MAFKPVLTSGVALAAAAAVVAAAPAVIPTKGTQVVVNASAELASPRSLTVAEVQLLASLTDVLAGIPDVYFNGYGANYQSWVDYQYARYGHALYSETLLNENAKLVDGFYYDLDDFDEDGVLAEDAVAIADGERYILDKDGERVPYLGDTPNAGVKGVINLITDALVPDVPFLNDSPYFSEIEHLDSDYLHGGLFRPVDYHVVPIVEDFSPFEGKYLKAYLDDGLLAGTLAEFVDEFDDLLNDVPSEAIRGFVAAGFLGAIAAIIEGGVPTPDLETDPATVRAIQVSDEVAEAQTAEPKTSPFAKYADLAADFDLGSNDSASQVAKAQTKAAAADPVADAEVPAAQVEDIQEVAESSETAAQSRAEESPKPSNLRERLADAGAEFSEAVSTAKTKAAERRAVAKERAQERREAIRDRLDNVRDSLTGGTAKADKDNTDKAEKSDKGNKSDKDEASGSGNDKADNTK